MSYYEAFTALWRWLTRGGTVEPDNSFPQVSTVEGAPLAANVLSGIQSFTSTTAATTIVTVPAGETWTGTIALSCDVEIVAASSTAGQALGEITVAGTGVTPSAGAYLRCEARCGANAAAGAVGSQAANSVSIPLVVVAPSGNSVTIQAIATIAGTAGRVDAMVAGRLV